MMVDVVDKLVALYERSPVLVAAYDGFDRLRYANEAFRSAYFIEAGEEPFWPDLMRRNFEARRGTVIRGDNFDEWLISTQSRRGKIEFRAFETDLMDGRWLWMTESVQSDGWMLCVASDITNLRAEDRVVRQDRDSALKAALTDELTGVANRRFVMARIAEMQNNANVQDAGPGCVAVIDLDNFKYINDAYGHPAGDLILRDFARRIHGQLRRFDCFGRIGGEEFALVLPNTSIEQGELILERMLAVVRLSRPLPGHPDFSYTFSAGIAAVETGEDAAGICGRADRALYAAKLAGRNRVMRDGSGLLRVATGT